MTCMKPRDVIRDEELVVGVLTGDESLFREIVERYLAMVWTVCLGYVDNVSDCEDVVQLVFVQCYKDLGSLRKPRAFRSWLNQVARNECRKWLRKTRRRQTAMSRYRDYLVGNGIQDHKAGPQRAELHQRIRNGISVLPAKLRTTLFLHYVEDYSVTEVAEALCISVSAVKKRLQRGRAALRDVLEPELAPALSGKRHNSELTHKVIAAIPFGSGAWLAKAGSTTAAISRPALIGGMIIMWKKLAIGLGTLLAVLLLAYGVVELRQEEGGEQKVATENMQAPEKPVATPVPLAEAREPDEQREVIAPPAAAPAPEAPSALPIKESEVTKALTEERDTSEPDEGVSPAYISGYVLDTPGEPLIRAVIRLAVESSTGEDDGLAVYDAKSDSYGRYEIPGIDAFGSGRTSASAKGYMMSSFPFYMKLDITPGMSRDDVNFTLRANPFTVSGYVLAENGRPIPEAWVSLRHFGYNEATLRRGNTGATLGGYTVPSDEEGYFEIGVSSAGLCDFTVSREGYGTGFFPGIETGTEDARFILKTDGGISGAVKMANGGPGAGMRIEVTGSAPMGGWKRPMTISASGLSRP
ncbi:sigma-70 family RNA polymerase sigma factor [Candidatus Hydrogenedentota bacterium]